MSFLEKVFGAKKESVQDIERAIAETKDTLTWKENESKLLKENMEGGRVPASPINNKNLESLGQEVQGLKDKLTILEGKKRLAEERAVEEVKQ